MSTAQPVAEQQQPVPAPQVPVAGLTHNVVKQVSENSTKRVSEHLGVKYPLQFNNPHAIFNNFPTEKELKRHIRHQRMLIRLERVRQGPITWDTIAEEHAAELNAEDEALSGYKGWKMSQLNKTTFEELETQAEREPGKVRGWVRRHLHI
jgi:hypothetical protein